MRYSSCFQKDNTLNTYKSRLDDLVIDLAQAKLKHYETASENQIACVDGLYKAFKEMKQAKPRWRGDWNKTNDRISGSQPQCYVLQPLMCCR